MRCDTRDARRSAAASASAFHAAYFGFGRDHHRAFQLEPRAARGRPLPRALLALGGVAKRAERGRINLVRLVKEPERARAIARLSELTPAIEEILRVGRRIGERASSSQGRR